MPKKTHEYILPFIRQESERTTSVIIVKLTTRKPAPTAEHQTKTIIEAVSRWVENTKDGKACYQGSCEDLNIGDLACHDKTFRKWLKTETLNLVNLEILWSGESSTDSMYFDRHLFEST